MVAPYTAASKPSMPFITNASADIYYECWSYPAARRILTLINGYGRPHNDFRRIGKDLVQAGFKVITLDNRAVGRSLVKQPFTLQDMCADVIALWQHLEIKTSAVLGISMGGAVAQLLTLSYPARVSHLVLVSSFCDTSFALNRNQRRWDSLADAQATLTNYVAADFYQNNQVLIAAIAKQMWQQRHQTNAAQQDNVVSGFTTRARLATISCPTLVIHGTEDRIINPQAAQVFAQTIPDTKLCMLPQAGHLLLLEKPTELRDQVIDFCAG